MQILWRDNLGENGVAIKTKAAAYQNLIAPSPHRRKPL